MPRSGTGERSAQPRPPSLGRGAARGGAGSVEGCGWCRGPIGVEARRDSKFCSKRCRQASHRFGVGCVARARAATPLRIAYADPPYPGLARRYYAGHPDFAGEVDHRELLARLRKFDGWALSTSARALPQVLALCVELGLDVRVAAWVRGARPHQHAAGPLPSWEPVVYVHARTRRGSTRATRRDEQLVTRRAVMARTRDRRPLATRLAPARSDASFSSTSDSLVHASRPRLTDPSRVIGAKPAAFCWWLFDLVGAQPGDSFADLFPGSGGVERAWRRYVSAGTDRQS